MSAIEHRPPTSTSSPPPPLSSAPGALTGPRAGPGAGATCNSCPGPPSCRGARRRESCGELVEGRDERVDLGVRVSHGKRPLLLTTGCHEDAAVHVPEPREVAQL